MTKTILSIFFCIGLLSCSSHPVLPTADDIKVTREDAGSKCKPLGSIEGRSSSLKSNPEEALADLKQEAIKKGANFVKIEMMGAQGTSVRGQAFLCP